MLRGNLLVVIALSCPAAQAIPPRHFSDEELGRMPIWVIAHWDKAEFKAHDLVQGNVLEESESYTRLVVDRVVRGDLKPGTHELRIDHFIGWAERGGPVMSYMSTQMIGDAKDVCTPNLWLLDSKGSWDKSDAKMYLNLSTYRAVQPAVLEPYFQALLAKDASAAVARLLGSDEPVVVLRALEYVHGSSAPWPYWSHMDEFCRGKPDPSKRCISCAAQVAQLLNHNNNEIRRMATAVFGSLAGSGGVERLRRQLDDADEGVRTIAIGSLAGSRDVDSIQRICNATRGIHDGLLACAAVDRLAAWGDERLAPALIEFLSEGEWAFTYGDDIGIPALRARAALKTITGFSFPFDSARSHAAWEQVRNVAEPALRVKRLAEILADDPDPIIARMAVAQAQATVEVINRSGAPISVATQPSDVSIRFPEGLYGHGSAARRVEDFATLQQASSLTFPIELPDGFLKVDPSKRSVRLHFLDNGHHFGLNSWIGIVDVLEPQSPQSAPSYDGYNLVWSDEFDKDGPPSDKNWIFETGFLRNDELQWYQAANARCKGGFLILEARRERVPNPNHDPAAKNWEKSRPHADYTSAAIETQGKHEWLYGRFEMRGRIDTRMGLWPAFWSMGSKREWPECGEIDIMEYFRDTLLANAAWGSDKQWEAAWDDSKTPLAKVAKDGGFENAEAWSKAFHIWRMDWAKDAIKLFVDDKLMNEIDLTKTINRRLDKANPFHEPHYLLLNLAIGGTQGGDPSKTEFPARFEVDWVRVYQKKDADAGAKTATKPADSGK